MRGQRLWDVVTAEHDLDGVQLTLLEAACRQADVLERLAPLAASGDVRACREERLTAAAQARMLAAMRLPDATGKRPQRRGGARGVYRPRVT